MTQTGLNIVTGSGSYFVEGVCEVIAEADRHERNDGEVGAAGVEISHRRIVAQQIM